MTETDAVITKETLKRGIAALAQPRTHAREEALARIVEEFDRAERFGVRLTPDERAMIRAVRRELYGPDAVDVAIASVAARDRVERTRTALLVGLAMQGQPDPTPRRTLRDLLLEFRDRVVAGRFRG